MVIVGSAFYIGLSLFLAFVAKACFGIIFGLLVCLSGLSALLGLMILFQRLFLPRMLKLTDGAILFPRGFLRMQTTKVSFDDILEMSGDRADSLCGLNLTTEKDFFEISVNYFEGEEDYLAAKQFMCSHVKLALLGYDANYPFPKLARQRFVGADHAEICWTESEIWPRYRTHLVVSKPLLPRLGRAAWFFTRCICVFVIPWLLLNYSNLDDKSALGFICLVLVVGLFFTLLHWLYSKYPERITKVSFSSRGIMQLSGKQTFSFGYRDFSAWNVIERHFDGSVLLILLLQHPKFVFRVSLPNTETRDRLMQLLETKNLPHSSSLAPPWE